MQVPTETRDTVPSVVTVHTLVVVVVKLTGNKELAVALTVKSGALTDLFARGPKVMIWLALVNGTGRAAEVAALCVVVVGGFGGGHIAGSARDLSRTGCCR